MTRVDLSYLESIASGDNAFIKQILEMFNASTLTEIEKMQGYYAKKEWANLGLTSHKIKSSVQMLGQPEIINMIVTLETNVKNKTDIDQTETLIVEIKERLIDLNSTVNKLIKAM